MSTLDELGNWSSFARSLDTVAETGGGTDIDEQRTHNTANELTSRKDGVSYGTTHSMTHDAVGNMTDTGTYSGTTAGTGTKLKYDVFGRLVQVQKWSAAGSAYHTVAQYRYNGLGYRIASHTPSVADAAAAVAVTESDPWYYHVYDNKWREVATFRGTKTASPATDAVDSWPKQVIVRHNAGLNGAGGNSYVDEIALRERDGNGDDVDGNLSDLGWRLASDGELEQRQYYCQNWRHDVVLLVDAIDGAPQVAERYRYSPYGVPWGISRADFNGDGTTDDGDFTPFGTAYDNADASVSNAWRYDMNLDGLVDDGDFPLFVFEYDRFTGIGYGKQSRDDVVNEFGYAGYNWDYAIDMDHVRRRVYSPLLGRWTRRDPAKFVDGAKFLQYARGNPVQFADSSGLCSSCCCCVDDIWVDNRSQYSTGAEMGHRFDVQVRLTHHKGNASGDCKLKWTQQSMEGSMQNSVETFQLGDVVVGPTASPAFDY